MALEFIQRETRQAAGCRRRLFALARRPLRRCAWRGGRTRRRQRQGKGDCTQGFPRGGDLLENVFAGNAMSRRTQWQYAVLLPRDPHGHVDQSIGKNVANGNTGVDCAEPGYQQGLRRIDARRREYGVPKHAGYRGAGGDEHLLPAVQGLLGRGERDRHHTQHLYAAWSADSQCVELVKRDQRLALEVRPGSSMRYSLRTVGPAGATLVSRKYGARSAMRRTPT